MPDPISGGGSGEWGWFKEHISPRIMMNAEAFTDATPTIVASGDYALFLSNDDGSTWESATSGANHIFASSGSTDILKYKIIGEPGTLITNIQIEVNV